MNEDHLPQLQRGKGSSATSTDTRTADSSVHNEARGAQIVQTNSLSTSALLSIMLGLAFCIGLSVVSFYIAQQAKTEARVALNHAEEERITNEVTKALTQICLSKKD